MAATSNGEVAVRQRRARRRSAVAAGEGRTVQTDDLTHVGGSVKDTCKTI
jgi:hypothetical protein